jgi:hypothetical protein
MLYIKRLELVICSEGKSLAEKYLSQRSADGKDKFLEVIFAASCECVSLRPRFYRRTPPRTEIYQESIARAIDSQSLLFTLLSLNKSICA